jgi:hypothetical protein
MSSDKHREKRDWRRVHHSPLFWVGLVLCLAAIAVYVLTEDLSWRPHRHAGTAARLAEIQRTANVSASLSRLSDQP